MGNWKCVKKVVARDLKLLNDMVRNLMNHLEAFPVKVRGKRHK
jgi:hypothetical protein